MRLTGYQVNTKEGLAGQPGLFYNYILAGNGLHVSAHGTLLKATVCIAPAEVRGLPALQPELELCCGRMPRYLYDLALDICYADPCRERYLAVTWEGEYRLWAPSQERSTCGVNYENIEGTVLDIHSHGHMKAFFSGKDNMDEQGFRLYMVVGRLDTMLPEVEMRVGVYGYFSPVQAEEVFAL